MYTWVSSLLALVALPVLKVAGHGFGYRVLLTYVAVVTVTLFGTVLLMQRVPGSGDGYPSGGSWPL